MGIELKAGQYFGQFQTQYEDNAFSCSITQYHPETCIGKHYHENDYVSLLVNGNYAEQNQSGRQILEPGQIIFRPALYDHSNDFMETGGACLNVGLKQDWQQKLDLNAKLPKDLNIYNAGTFPSLYKLFYHLSANSHLVTEYIMDWISEYNRENIPQRLPWLSKAISILENETEMQHSIDSIADRVCVHPVYFSRAFKQRTGLTPGEYQLKIKIGKAIRLLFTTHYPIGEIAIGCGFYDTAHLIKSFRLVYATTPKKFQSRLKG